MRTLAFLLCMSICAPAFAEDVWVKRRKLDVRAGKGAAYDVVVSVAQGDKLSVVAREDKWLKVQFGGKEGYVYEESISPREVSKQKMAFADSNAAALSADAASKGLQPGAEDYARKHNVKTGAVEKMIAMRKQITGKDYEQFAAEGNLGRASS